MIEKSELAGIIENAFKPLKCVAELHEYEAYVWLRVYIPNREPIFWNERVPELETELLADESYLESVVRSIRSQIEAMGITLDKWSLPNRK